VVVPSSKVTGVIQNRQGKPNAACWVLGNLESPPIIFMLYALGERAHKWSRFPYENMSPLVQRQRSGRSEPTDQHWSMLLFESCSAGVAALFVGGLAVLAVVGLYTLLIWPLTMWDIRVPTEQYESWASTVLWSIFAGGTLAGFCCFSGWAYKGKSKPRPALPTRNRAVTKARL
jgi:hypothetical protein